MPTAADLRRSAFIVAVFAIAGPAIGGIAWALLFVIIAPVPSENFVLGTLALIFMAILFAYSFGLVPAVLTGVVVSQIHTSSRALVIVVSALFGGAVAFVFHHFRFPTDELQHVIGLAVIPAVSSGAVLGFAVFPKVRRNV